jgi:hypothetical protein
MLLKGASGKYAAEHGYFLALVTGKAAKESSMQYLLT